MTLPAVLFTLLWATVSSSFTPANLALGLALASASLWLVRHDVARAPPRRVQLVAALGLALFFVRELVLSAIQVARVVLARRLDLKPGVFAYPLQLERDGQIALLANLITLTPGTLSIDVSADRRTLFVHALDCSDPDALRRDIARGFARRIREAFP